MRFCEDCGTVISEKEAMDNFCPCGLGPLCGECLDEHMSECEEKDED